jgi:hypothetical protein
MMCRTRYGVAAVGAVAAALALFVAAVVGARLYRMPL